MIAISTSRGISLRVSVTDRCQLRCRYCMPPEGIPLHGRNEILSYEEIMTLVGYLHGEFGLARVRITGGEPLIRPGMERLVGMLSAVGIPDLALTTNGLRLSKMAPVLKRAGLHRVNVSLDSLSPVTFRRLTGGGELRDVLEGIASALDQGLRPLKLNTVVIRGINDEEVGRLLAFALDRNCEARFIELMPIGPGTRLFPAGFVSSETVRLRLSSDFTLRSLGVEAGASARRYGVTDADGRRGTLGFVSSCSAPFCQGCTRLRVTADGRLMGCLAKNEGISVRGMLRAGDTKSVCDAVRRLLDGKRTEERVFEQSMAMAAIGG